MKTKKTLYIVAFCIIFSLIITISVFAENTSEYFGDLLVFKGDTSHNVTLDTKSSVRSLKTMRAGEFEDEKYDVLKLGAKGGSVAFDMAISSENVVLEFEEIHNKNEDSYGYYVNVDGTDVFLRAGAETSVGPLHFFVNVPEELTSGKNKIRVTLKNISDSAVSLSRVWAHSNLDLLLQQEDIDSQMTLMLFHESFGWTRNRRVEEIRPTLESWISVYGDETTYQNFDPGFLFEINYLSMHEEYVYSFIDEIVKSSRELDVTVGVNLNSWWGGTPINVPDGKGGFFTDVAYQQLTYSPYNTNGRGVYQTSQPAAYKYPWLSLNNEYLNTIRLEKYKKICAYISQKLAESQVINGDKKIPQFSLLLENEPQYWHEFIFTTNEADLICDVSQMVVDDIKEKYGVIIDPTDGITEEEEEVLFYNVNDYQIAITQAAAEGAGKDYIIVNGDELTLPHSQLMDNFYTHQYDTNEQKRVESEWDTYETSITKNGHIGLEGYGLFGTIAKRNIGDHAAARGKFAGVNIETSATGTSIEPLDDYYTFGADYGCLFNVQKAAQPFVAAMDSKVQTEKYTEPFEGRELGNYDIDKETDFEPNGFLIEADGIGVGSYGARHVACPQDTDNEGSMTFCVDNKGEALDDGLVLTLYGICRADLNASCKIEIYAGNDLENLTLAETVTSLSLGGTTFDLSEYIDSTMSVAYFKVRILTCSTTGWSSVFKIRACEKFGEILGHTNGFNYTMVERRLNNLIVSYRADVESMLAEQKAYCGTHPDYVEAERLYKLGRYKSAKQLLLGTESLKMPAKFMVAESGKLGDYPVSVDIINLGIPVGIVLRELGENVKFEVSADEQTEVALNFYDKKGRYTLQKAGNIYTLSKSESGEYIEEGGVVTVNLTVNGYQIKELPKKITGFINTGTYNCDRNWNAYDKDIFISFHDEEITGYSGGIYFDFAQDAVVLRGPIDAGCGELAEFPKEEIGELVWGERADITLNDAGEISKLELRYGHVTGTVTKFIEAQLPEMTSPYMEITEYGTGEKWLFKIDSKTLFDSSKTGSATDFKGVSPGMGIGFKVGNFVNVCYLPLKAADEEHYYATKIYEEYINVVDEQLNDESYKDSVYSENGVKITALDSNNANVIGLASSGSTGSVVWKIESDEPIKEVVVKYSGRAIMGSNVEIKASSNGYIYDEISDLQTIFKHNFNTIFSCYTDDSKIVGGKVVYIKADFNVTAGTTWGFLNSIKIDIKV